jgi:CheY-like chemotaxis protein/HPt (histidine-containing phosphotransfer) domain-containing protein
LRFLVVDDDELSRELLAMLLESEGHEVEVTASGEEALARLSGENSGGSFEPDGILADMQMSGVSGAELASLLRAVSRRKTLLLAMSASQPGAAQLTGFDGFLLKPFKMEDLTAALGATKPGTSAQEPVSLTAAAADDGEDELPALNEVVHGQLAKSMTGVQLGQMYALCLSDARMRIARMAAAAEAGDDVGYRKEAHTVKGGCGLIGATELYRLSETAECNGLQSGPGTHASDGISRIKALLSRLFRACDRLERILDEHV